MLCAPVLLAACTTSADREAPSTVATAKREADRPAHTAKDQIVDISPAEALTPLTPGMRVRWSGGINAIDARDGGRQCFTLLHATFDAQRVLQWPRDAQEFVACGPGDYDRRLVAPFGLLSIDGRLVGSQRLRGKAVPVIEIDALYRHSDCVQGSEKSPECYAGYLQPEKP
ncbi:hypothetical protein [Variovorax sp. LT1R16]|uniref:hypothetical protein n=1 Tax=Variovorax sp. LT1R16 TaxID=3443728 RepID=UPI003F464E41